LPTPPKLLPNFEELDLEYQVNYDSTIATRYLKSSINNGKRNGRRLLKEKTSSIQVEKLGI
jgi:hypothetical protein